MKTCRDGNKWLDEPGKVLRILYYENNFLVFLSSNLVIIRTQVFGFTSNVGERERFKYLVLFLCKRK